MKARDAVGKKIVEISQERFWDDNSGCWVVRVIAIRLSNGTSLLPSVHELGGDFAVDMLAVKRSRR